MEHIIHSSTAGIDFTRYAAYVESIRHKLPAHVYAFASDSRYFDLNSHSSLHDAWLESLTVNEGASGERKQVRKLEVHLRLLGPCHDRLIYLRYTGIIRYRFDTPARQGESRFQHTAHGDIITHEIRLGAEGSLIHELLFERNSTFLVECADLRHSEEMIDAP